MDTPATAFSNGTPVMMIVVMMVVVMMIVVMTVVVMMILVMMIMIQHVHNYQLLYIVFIIILPASYRARLPAHTDAIDDEPLEEVHSVSLKQT